MKTAIKKGVPNWGYFDSKNKQHRTILALMRQAAWVTSNEKHGEVPDTQKLSSFLKSNKSPVKKPLKDMTPKELSKIITALEGVVKHKYNKWTR